MSETAARKLATIVALDVAGYSARTEADEATTTAEVAALRPVIEGIGKAHGGRLFNTAGDGFMLEFGSSLAAVEAAVELAEKCSPPVRVGVHLGDVAVQANGDLLGHGVNVAARLMAQSAPGSALVSADVRRTIRGPLAARLVSRGLLQLDKMAETIEGFVLVGAPIALDTAHPKTPEPMLAVLPFDNLSADPEMQFFSDGVSEEILQRLSRGAKLKVVGRTSSFQLRGERKMEAARILKCTHVLDGSIRRAGGRVRIAAHLVDTASQTTLWSDRFDRRLEDIFAVQDEISESIASALNRTIASRSTAAIAPAIYDIYLRAIARGYANEEISPKIAWLEDVTRRAPAFADAWGRLAELRAYAAYLRPFSERPAIAKRAAEEAARALDLDPHNAAAASAQFHLLPPFGAFLEMEATAVRLRQYVEISTAPMQGFPAHAYHAAGVGRIREAIDQMRRMNERDALNPATQHFHGLTLWLAGRNAEARKVFETSIEHWPDHHYSAITLIMLAAFEQDWATVDALMSPERLARFPLHEFTRDAIAFAAVLRDPSPQSRRRPIEAARRRFERTAYSNTNLLAFAAQMGAADEALDIAVKAKLGPAGDRQDVMGVDAYRTPMLFHAMYFAFRQDPRFVRLCAKLGLVEYWLATERWPDCTAEVPYDFKAECENVRHVAKQAFGA